MNRTIKDATVKRYYYAGHQQLAPHRKPLLNAYSCAHRLKAMKGLVPQEHLCRIWTEPPGKFSPDPCCHTSGLNT